ncbi:hypothetical protein EDB19DRAFT_1983776 [Suillus lakei]|nr:hypothetical protein EDB19DRAFT_1983776 [Suillus lakei]
MDSLQWHMHTFASSSYDNDSDWDSDTSSNSYQMDLDLRSHHHCPSIDSTNSSGPLHPLDAFLELAVAPEDLPDPYKLARTPDDSTSIWSDDPQSPRSDPESEYDDEELLILNTPDALYQLFLKEKLQVRINSLKRWELLCPDCAEWCQTGIHSGINLWISGQFVSLSNHRGSRKCHQKAARKKPSVPEKDDSVFDAPSTQSSFMTSNHMGVLLSTYPRRDCPGLTVAWPQDLRPFVMLFPWERYHEGPDSLPFLVDISNSAVPRHITQLADAARNPKSHTNYRFLGLAHMQDLTKGYANQTRQLRLQGLNESRQYMSTLTQLDDYSRLLMAISEQDIPWLQQIINIALRNGAGVWEIVNKLEDALEGVYRPRGYGASDLDIATLVFRLGGHQLLFALNQSLGLPSIHTLRTRSTFTVITPMIGPIRNEQLDENIRSVVLSSHTCITALRGVSLMVDEIALEEMVVHFSKYNKIAGLCWKHSHLVDPVLRTYESAITIAQKIHDSEVHLGKELTVIGAACFGEDELYPILVALTCKTENAGDMEIMLTRTIEWWNITGAAASVGPVWSFATNGDATRRAAGHKIFLKKLLSPELQLYGILNNMPGLNTMTGDAENILILPVGFCMLIRSPAGIVLNNGRVINAMMLSRYLVWLPAYDEASVMKLLHPDDPQDVPRAIELMQAIVDFSKSQYSLLSNSFSTDVDTRANLMSITLLSNVIESILILFINPKLFLTEQLYYDTQTCIKNIIFNIAKQQLLDPDAPFFLGDCGDDRLELMFGRSRMIGGHNSGCSYSQALDCLGAAKDIDGMFNRHPELDPGHRRLSLGKRVEDVDHINQIDPINYSFTNLFHDPGTNTLCPLGMNKYFGIAEEELDDSKTVIFEAGDIQRVHLGADEDDEELMLTFEEELVAQSASDGPPTQPHTPPTVPSALQGPGIHTNDYLLYKGRWIHKHTIC